MTTTRTPEELEQINAELLTAVREARSFMDYAAVTDPDGDPFGEDDEESRGLNEMKAQFDALIAKAERTAA